jgi:hypothetical protein
MIHDAFPTRPELSGDVTVRDLTPDLGGCIVRFFDTPAISPGGRYLACFRLPFEDRLPRPGERGEIVIVDLHEGPAATRVVATTAGWEPQLGANLNWGGDDRTLLFADVDEAPWTPQTVVLDWPKGERRRLDAPIYHASPDGRSVVGTNPRLMCRTQRGYGIVVPDEHCQPRIGAPVDDGVWLTETDSGEKQLLHSLANVVDEFGGELGIEQPDDWRIYAFHCKIAPTNDCLLFTLRYLPAGHAGMDAIRDKQSGLNFAVFTSRLDGSELALVLGPDRWKHGGHHVNFAPDGQSLTANLRDVDPIDPKAMRFVRTSVDRDDVQIMLPGVQGGGHPTLHPDGRHLLSDCYWREQWADPVTGTTPLRWLDLHTGEERHVARAANQPIVDEPTLRIDPHPCWDRTWQFVTFNSVINGQRHVMLADMRPLLGAT